jgi:predicted dehydrogenase
MSVIVEKPFCMSSAEADRVLAAAEKSGKLLSVFQSETSLLCTRTS